jgi:lipopolysaccharide transport system permease protein
MTTSRSSVQRLHLLRQLVLQEIRGRYLGSVLGLFWLVLVPLLTLALYSVVFGTFMKARWGTQESTGISSFALVLFPGLLVFNYFAECVNRAPTLVVAQPNYVKKVVFPLPLLAFVPLISALLQFFVGIGVWCVMSLLLGQGISLRIFFIPLLMLPFAALVLGIVWAVSALSVYLRDLTALVPIVTQVLMFLSPVLYPVENVPSHLRWIFLANPLTFVVENARALMITDAPFAWLPWMAYCVAGVLCAWVGLAVFRKLRPGFADVI